VAANAEKGKEFMSWAQTASIIVAIIAAIWYQTHYADKRIEDLRSWVDAKFEALGERLKSIDTRLGKIEERLDHVESAQRVVHP
jgi:hypothetical protein